MDSNSNVTGEPDVVRHDQYYFSLITFRVENCLFKLPRHFIQQSEVFQAMCAVAQADTEEGTCDQNPISLAQTTSKDFEAFLKAAMPMAEGGSRNTLSCQEWLAVLELAHKWDFKNTRRLAIEALDKLSMDEVEKVRVIQKYDIKEWACAAYEKLMVREGFLTANEMKSLGFEFTSKMAQARETMMKKTITSALTPWSCSCGRHSSYYQSQQPLLQCPYCHQRRPSPSDDPTTILSVIREVFGDPICIL